MREGAATVYGMVARFGEAEELLAAVRKAKEAGYSRMDAYTPFMVEGLVDELNHRDDRVPKLVFGFGMLGAAIGFLMQVYAACYDYPLNIGGRPDFSWPSFIPITFETGVVFASFAALFGMLGLNGLPRFHHPVFGANGFERVTDDKFFLCIEARDPKFESAKAKAFLEGLGAEEVVEVVDE
jgi:hypothetical protein